MNQPINGQGLEPYAGIPYGRSTLGYSGCEAIAIYNFMLLIGRPVTLESVMGSLVRRFKDPAHPLSGWGMRGRFGAAPGDIAAYLKAQGVTYQSARTLGGMERLVRGPGALIISFWNKPVSTGYHTVAVDFDGSRYTGYNCDCYRQVARMCGALSGFLYGKRRFIRGFYVPYE